MELIEAVRQPSTGLLCKPRQSGTQSASKQVQTPQAEIAIGFFVDDRVEQSPRSLCIYLRNMRIALLYDDDCVG